MTHDTHDADDMLTTEERLKILEMLQAGTISADEAEKLLMGSEARTAPDDNQAIITPLGANRGATATKDVPQFKNFWQWIFATGSAIFLFFGLIVASVTTFLTLLCLGPVMMVGFGLAAVGLWSRSSHWIHIRINSRNGDKVKLSLPFPIMFTSLIMRFVQPFIKHQTGDVDLGKINIAALIREMGDALSAENPLVVSVNDDDDQVLVYIT